MDRFTLNDMATCDFTVPLNVTVLYDDSDDDDKSFIPIVIDEGEENKTANDIEKDKHVLKNTVEHGNPVLKNYDVDDKQVIDNNIEKDRLILDSTVKHDKHVLANNIESDKQVLDDTVEDDIQAKSVFVSCEPPISFRKNHTSASSKRSYYESSGDETKKKKKKKKVKRHSKDDKVDKLSQSQTEATSNTHPSEREEKSHGDNVGKMQVSQISPNSLKIKIGLRQSTDSGKKDNNDLNMENNIQTKQKEDFEQVSSYIKDILDAVSENLILALVAYQQHARTVSKKNHDKNPNIYAAQIEESKNRYARWKCHFYQLSYCAAAHIIVPQENHDDFTATFLENTVILAKNKMGLTYTKRDIEPFYRELIAWTKLKKSWLQNGPYLLRVEEPKTKQTLSIEAPTLSKQLAQPPILPKLAKKQKAPDNRELPIPPSFCCSPSKDYPNLQRVSNCEVTAPISVPYIQTNIIHKRDLKVNNLNQHRVSNQDSQKFTIFSHGGPGSNTRIDVSPEIMEIQNLINQFPRYPPAQHLKDIRHHSTVSSSRFGPVSSANHSNENVRSHFFNAANSDVPTISAANASVYNYQYNYLADSNKQHLENYQRVVKNPHQQYHPTNSNQQYHTINPHQQYQQQQQTAGEDRCQIRTTMPKEQNHLPYLNEEPSDQSASLEQSVEYCRSSVSTDSGFTSPLQFKIGPADKTVSTGESQNLVPTITHVTSLNPKALQIAEGPCHVCGAMSKTKCLGCYQVYYCNYYCQRIDWDMHMDFCKKVHDTRRI